MGTLFEVRFILFILGFRVDFLYGEEWGRGGIAMMIMMMIIIIIIIIDFSCHEQHIEMTQ